MEMKDRGKREKASWSGQVLVHSISGYKKRRGHRGQRLLQRAASAL